MRDASALPKVMQALCIRLSSEKELKPTMVYHMVQLLTVLLGKICISTEMTNVNLILPSDKPLI